MEDELGGVAQSMKVLVCAKRMHICGTNALEKSTEHVASLENIVCHTHMLTEH